MKKVLPLLIFAFLFANFQARASLAVASLTLSPATKSVKVGDVVTVSVLFDTSGETVNSVKASITFPVSLLSVETDSIDTTGSAITDFKETIYSNLSGTVDLSGTTNTSGSQKLVANIKFKTKAVGTANVSFDSDSQMVRATDSKNILSLPDSKGGTYTIATTVAPAPVQKQASPTVIPQDVGFTTPTYLLAGISGLAAILGIFLIRKPAQNL